MLTVVELNRLIYFLGKAAIVGSEATELSILLQKLAMLTLPQANKPTGIDVPPVVEDKTPKSDVKEPTLTEKVDKIAKK
jgi:hypothetical protein